MSSGVAKKRKKKKDQIPGFYSLAICETLSKKKGGGKGYVSPSLSQNAVVSIK